MKKRVPQGKKNEKQTGKASCFQLVEKRIAHFKDSRKLKTANNYACALKHFRDFRANKDLAIGDLSAGLMRDFQSYLTEKGLTMNTISLYNRSLRAVYNYALDEGILTTDKRPFRKVFTGLEKTRKRALDSEVAKTSSNCPFRTMKRRLSPATCFFSACICKECHSSTSPT